MTKIRVSGLSGLLQGLSVFPVTPGGALLPPPFYRHCHRLSLKVTRWAQRPAWVETQACPCLSRVMRDQPTPPRPLPPVTPREPG